MTKQSSNPQLPRSPTHFAPTLALYAFLSNISTKSLEYTIIGYQLSLTCDAPSTISASLANADMISTRSISRPRSTSRNTSSETKFGSHDIEIRLALRSHPLTLSVFFQDQDQYFGCQSFIHMLLQDLHHAAKE